MGLVARYKCADTIFDIYDVDRVPRFQTEGSRYFVTPARVTKIEKWLISNGKDQIKTQEDMKFLIENDFIGTYK